MKTKFSYTQKKMFPAFGNIKSNNILLFTQKRKQKFFMGFVYPIEMGAKLWTQWFAFKVTASSDENEWTEELQCTALRYDKNFTSLGLFCSL